MTKQLGPGSRILIVEDQVIIAMDAETLLKKHGIDTIDSAMTNEEALDFIAAARPDAAILDFSLGQTTSLPVAKALKALGVPFVFATGFDDQSEIPRELAGTPIVGKPYSGETLVAGLNQAIAQRPA